MDAKRKFFLHKLVKFVAEMLKFKSLPRKIVISDSPQFIEKHLSFGIYAPDTDEIHIYGGNRHIADVCRTLCHELVHHRQRELGKPSDGRDGSPIENEANAMAGTLMRKFRYQHPEIYAEK